MNSTSEQQPAPWLPAWAWITIAALGSFIICMLFADRRGLWLDEYTTLDVARMPLSELVANRFEAGHSPLHFLMAKVFLVLGESERALRFSSALAAGLASALVMLIAARAGLQRAFPALAFAAVLCPYWIEAGTMYRYMMPLAAAGAGLMLVLYRHQLAPRAATGLLLTALTALCLWLHFSAQFVVLALVGFVIADSRARGVAGVQAYALRLGPLLAGYVLGLPFVYLIRKHEISNATEAFEPRWIVEGIAGAYYSSLKGWSELLDIGSGVVIFALLAALVGCFVVLRRALAGRAETETLLRMLIWSVAGVTGVILAVQLLGGRFRVESRYVSAMSPALVLAVGLGLHAMLREVDPRLKAAGVAVALTIAAQGLFAAVTHGDAHRDVLHWVMEHNTEQDTTFIMLTRVNRVAFRREGYTGELIGGLPTRSREAAEAREWLKSQWGDRQRGFIVYYKSRAQMREALEEMIRAGELVDAREWRFSSTTRLFFFIRSEAERPWLEKFTPPQGLLWDVSDKSLSPGKKKRKGKEADEEQAPQVEPEANPA